MPTIETSFRNRSSVKVTVLTRLANELCQFGHDLCFLAESEMRINFESMGNFISAREVEWNDDDYRVSQTEMVVFTWSIRFCAGRALVATVLALLVVFVATPLRVAPR